MHFQANKFISGFQFSRALIATAISVFILSLAVFGIVSAYSTSKYTIYFYNPESNVDSFASMKTRLDIYFQTFGAYRFQPFSERKTFEAKIKGKNDGLMILSSWHYKNLREQFSIKPVLVGVVDEKTTQRRVLSSKNMHSPEELREASLASAGSEDYTRSLLTVMLGPDKKGLVDSIRILSVPKDIDALISVGFGLADAALTTEYSVAMLSSINSRLHEKLKTIAISKESLLPIVAVPKKHDPEVANLLEVLEEMGNTRDGKKGIQMIGLDSWKRLDEKEARLLER